MNWWAIPGWFLGLISLAFAIRNERRRRREKLHRQQRFEWEHVTQGVRQLCVAIERDGFRPDALLAVPGAGLILTELAVIHWGDRLPVYVVQQLPSESPQTFGPGRGTEVQTSKWRYWIPEELRELVGKKLLILDDYAPSGDTLRALRQGLQGIGLRRDDIRTAVLVGVEALKEVDKAPDYTWFFVDTYDVHMPWGHASKRRRSGAWPAA